MMRNKDKRTQASITKVHTQNLNSYHKQLSKLLDSTNIKIISGLLKNPSISSISLAKRLDIPFSTLQRRRLRIEKAMLKKTYAFNFKAFGARIGDLIVDIDKGRSDEVAQSILKSHKNNIEYCHSRIDSTHSVLAHVVYKETAELFYLTEDIKTMEYVRSVQWSEMVNVIGDNASEIMNALFTK
jgi:DNA-binding Lrp family transcriptional regulator